jgi:hypothetical protein
MGRNRFIYHRSITVNPIAPVRFEIDAIYKVGNSKLRQIVVC